MIEIFTGIITELAVQAITKSAGPLTRSVGLSKPSKPPEWLVKSISPSVTSNIMSMLAEFNDKGISDEAITRTAQTLRSIEAQYLQRMLVVNVITDRSGVQPRLKEQVEALLIYVGNCSREDAEAIAPAIAKIMTSASIRSVEAFRLASGKYYGIIKSLAFQEETAGYVEQLFSSMNPQDTLPTSEELARIDTFATSYAEEMLAKASWLTPQHFDIQTRVRLDDLYVAPRFVARGGDIDRLMPMADTSDIYAPEIDFPLGHAMRRMYRAIVLGAPGAGKTTLTQKIIYDLCRDPSVAHECLPFLVTLRKYDERRREAPVSITQYIATSISTELHITVSEHFIEYFLRTGRAVIILDGLDELLQPSRRKDLTEIVHSFSRRYSKSSVIVTSRIVGYDEASLDSKVFAHMYLTDFNSDEVAKYAKNWFQLTPTLDASEHLAVTQDFLSESESVAELRTNPLLLSLMCNIYRGKGYIPQNRSDLYERCATMLFDEWDRSRGIESGGPLRGDAKYALQDIAYWALTNRELDSGIPEPMLKMRLRKFLRSTRYGSAAMAEEAASELLQLWRGRAWILTDLGSDALHRVYQFSHRTFLEYFAATYLARRAKTPKRLWEELRVRAVSGEWDIVAEIAIQTYNSGNAGTVDDIYKLIIARMNGIGDISALTAEILEELRFACRHLDALAPGPRVLNDLTVIAVKLIMWTLPCFKNQPDWSKYASKKDLIIPEAVRIIVLADDGDRQEDTDEEYEDEDYEYEDEETGRSFRTLEETVQLLNAPLALIFDSSPVILSIASKAFDRYCRKLILEADFATASRALLMLLSKFQFVESSKFSIMGAERSMGALELPNRLNNGDSDVMPHLPSDTIELLARENFWVPIIVTQHNYRGIAWLLNYAGLTALFNADSPFDVLIDLARPCLAEELILRYVSGNAVTDDRDALREIGRLVRTAYVDPKNVALVELNWLVQSRLGTSIVMGHFLNNPGLGVENGYYDRYWSEDDIEDEPCTENDLDVVLGAAAVLCIFAESEDWDMQDLSADRLASLALGPVAGLEGIYLMRYGGENITAKHLRARTGLGSADVELLLAWAKGSVSFTYGGIARDR